MISLGKPGAGSLSCIFITGETVLILCVASDAEGPNPVDLHAPLSCRAISSFGFIVKCYVILAGGLLCSF